MSLKDFSNKFNQPSENYIDDRPIAFPIEYNGPAPYQKVFNGCGFGVVFEDDGETGYFYATDESQTKIFDAMLLYNSNTSDQVKSTDQIFIVWNPILLKAGIYYRDKFQAIVDFKNNKACSRTGFPNTANEWLRTTHEWDDSMNNGLQ